MYFEKIIAMVKIFIAGTDTDVGKTTVACALLQALRHQGYSVLGIKPLASGCEMTTEGLRNSDALKLQAQSSLQLPYDQINPIAFSPPIAPHLAAKDARKFLSVEQLTQVCQPALAADVQYTVIEGSGGWLVPLNMRETMADFVIAQRWAVILVVGIKLGCLNQALLTTRVMQEQGVPLVGWVANQVDPTMPYALENIQDLRKRLSIPCCAQIPYGKDGFKKINVGKINTILSETVTM